MQSLIIPHKNKGHRLTCGGAQNNYSIFFRTQHLGHYWYCLLRIFLTVALHSTTTHADNNKNIKYTTLVTGWVGDQWQRFACNLVELYFSNHLIVVIVCGHRRKRAGQRDYNSIFIKSVHRTQKEDAKYIGAQGMPTIESAMPGNQLNQETTMWTMSIKSRVKSSLNAPSADDDDGAQQLSL